MKKMILVSILFCSLVVILSGCGQSNTFKGYAVQKFYNGNNPEAQALCNLYHCKSYPYEVIVTDHEITVPVGSPPYYKQISHLHYYMIFIVSQSAYNAIQTNQTFQCDKDTLICNGLGKAIGTGSME